MKRILVPLDGSSLSEAIVPVAEGLACDHDAELLLLRAPRPRGSLDAEAEVLKEAEGYLAARVEALQARGLRAEEHLSKVASALWAKGLRVAGRSASVRRWTSSSDAPERSASG